MRVQIRKQIAVAAVLCTSALAYAVPATYTMTVDGVTATVNGVSTGPGTTTVIAINADTAAITVAGAQQCVVGTSGTISNTGINGGTPQALTGSYYVCASNVGNNVGVYSTAAFNNPVHGGNSGGGTGALTGAPAVNLANNLPVTTYIASTIHSHGGFGGVLNLAAGGTYSSTLPEPPGTANSTASSFSITGIVAASPASIPTLSEWGVIILASLMGMLGLASARRRRG